jgi:hypothetical protein
MSNSTDYIDFSEENIEYLKELVTKKTQSCFWQTNLCDDMPLAEYSAKYANITYDNMELPKYANITHDNMELPETHHNVNNTKLKKNE